MRFNGWILAAALAAAGWAACDGKDEPRVVTPHPQPEPEPDPRIATIAVWWDPDRVCPIELCTELYVGDSLPLFARAFDEDGVELDGVEVTWSSNDEAVGAIDGDGVVEAKAPGATTIEARNGDVVGTVDITVLPTRVASITIEQDAHSVAGGESATFTAVALDDDGKPIDNPALEWLVGNPLVASIDQNGVVTGITAGDAIVEVAAMGGAWDWAVVHVTSGGGDTFAQPLSSVAVGINTTCGVDEATGAWCWGANDYGQMGVGRLDDPFTGFPVPENVIGEARFVALSANSFHTCGLTAEGAAYCWGLGVDGRLGVFPDGSGDNGTTAPMPVLGDHVFTQIAAGGDHTCGLDDAKKVWCWGLAERLGIGEGPEGADQWLPAAVAPDQEFVQVVGGLFHNCALDTAGKAWCWGGNEQGAVGDGSNLDGTGTLVVRTPVAVAGDLTFAELDTVSNHTCGRTIENEVWCWGDNFSEQIGPRDPLFEGAPRRVETALQFAQVATGTHHTCGLTAAGEVWCWGANGDGQLGDGTLLSSDVPVRVITELAFVAIDAGGNMTCGVTADDAVWCWGSSHMGQLGGGFAGPGCFTPWPVLVKQQTFGPV